MAKLSTNLSNRLFFTVNYNDGSARIGTLDSPQKDLVELDNDELIGIIKFLIDNNILEDIIPIKNGDEDE